MPEYLAEFSKYLGVTTKGMKDSMLSELAAKLEDFYRSKGLDALIDYMLRSKFLIGIGKQAIATNLMDKLGW
jgi:hypothetical protein